MKNLKYYNEINEAKVPGVYIVKVESSRNGRDRTKYVKGTLEDLIGYFGYTLEVGNSWNRKINKQPKTIKAFIKSLQDSYSEKEAAIYNRTYVNLVDEIPANTPPSDISDQTLREGQIHEANTISKVDFLIFSDYLTFGKKAFADMYKGATYTNPNLLDILKDLAANCKVELFLSIDDMDLIAKAIKKPKYPYIYIFTEDESFYVISSSYQDLLNRVGKPTSR